MGASQQEASGILVGSGEICCPSNSAVGPVECASCASEIRVIIQFSLFVCVEARVEFGGFSGELSRFYFLNVE